MNQDNKFIRSLIQSALRGNNSALEQLFEMNLPKIYTLTFRLTSNLQSAELLTENILVETWKQLNFLREDATFSTWLTGIAVYQSLNYLRENDNPQIYEVEQLPSKNQLEKIILALPKNERISFILHYLEGYSVDEVSDLLAISRTDTAKFLAEAESKVITRSPDIESQDMIAERFQKIKVDIKPNIDLIDKAFVDIYRLKSEEEVKEQFLNEKKSGDESEDKKENKTSGLGGIFRKIFPKK